MQHFARSVTPDDDADYSQLHGRVRAAVIRGTGVVPWAWIAAMTDDSDDQSLARDMIEVHGLNAATVARDNARGAALAGQAMQAKAWIRVLGTIQRQQAARAPPICGDC
jgi:hypothetical protein